MYHRLLSSPSGKTTATASLEVKETSSSSSKSSSPNKSGAFKKTNSSIEANHVTKGSPTATGKHIAHVVGSGEVTGQLLAHVVGKLLVN